MENTVSFFATVASLVLAVIAIWLSLYFYKQSNALAESTKEAAKEIKSGVERLEKLFDKLYEGTFSVMKDTVSDMRRHIWPEDAANAKDAQAEIDKKTEEKLDEFRQEMAKEVAIIAEQLNTADGKLEETKIGLHKLVKRAIDGSIEVEREVKEENIRDAIIASYNMLSNKDGIALADSIIGRLINSYPLDDILKTLNEMHRQGDLKLVTKEGWILPPSNVSPSSHIFIATSGWQDRERHRTSTTS